MDEETAYNDACLLRLSELSDSIVELETKRKELAEERDHLVVSLRGSGESILRISEFAGLSRTAIYKIAKDS